MRAWMMIPQTGEWKLLREYNGQIGHHYVWDSNGNRTDRTGDQLSYQWKVGHYVNETDWISLDYDNVAYGKRWNNITKNRLIGYKKSVLNLKFDEGAFLGTTRAGAGGVFLFTDANTPAFPMRFYRVLSP